MQQLTTADHRCEELASSYSYLEELNVQWSNKNSTLLEEIDDLKVSEVDCFESVDYGIEIQ